MIQQPHTADTEHELLADAMLGVTAVDGAPYYGYLDNVLFWIPGIVALCALLVTCLLLAGWIAGRARVARSS